MVEELGTGSQELRVEAEAKECLLAALARLFMELLLDAFSAFALNTIFMVCLRLFT